MIQDRPVEAGPARRPGEPCIVALGGEDWTEPGGSALDDFVLGLAGRERPRVLFVPTASGDADSYIAQFYRAFPASRYEPAHLSLFFRDVEDLRATVLGSDVVYVGGGNTANMLATWRVHGLDEVLGEAWQAGIVLSGVSAGMICWFEAGVTDSFGRHLSGLRDGLGLLPGSACPHYDGEALRRPRYHELVAAGFPAGLAAEDSVGLRFAGTELVEVVAHRAGGSAWRVSSGPDGVVEERLQARLLG